MKTFLVQQSSFDNKHIIRSNGFKIVSQGYDNLYPEYLLDLLHAPTHGAIVNTKTFFTTGSGLEGNEDFNDMIISKNLINKLASDLVIFGGYAIKIVWSKNRDKIANFDHVPMKNIRFEVDEFNNITNLVYKDDQTNTKRNKIPAKNYPLYNPLTKVEEPIQILLYGNYNPYDSPYPHPSYDCAIEYIETERRLSKYHLNSIKNNFIPSVIVTTSNKFADETEEQEFVKNFKSFFQGDDNAFKAMIVNSEPNNQGDTRSPDFKTFDSGVNVDIFNNLDYTCMQKIVTAHGLTSQLLAALPNNTVFSNGQEILAAYELFFNTTISYYQKNILWGINVITKQNGIEPTSIINKKPISDTFSENVLLQILTKDELRKVIGYSETDETSVLETLREDKMIDNNAE